MSCYITVVSVRKKDVEHYNLLHANSINEFFDIASVLSYSFENECCNSDKGREALDFFRNRAKGVEEHKKGEDDDYLYYIKDVNDYIELLKIIDDEFEEFNTPECIEELKDMFKDYYTVAQFSD